MKSRTKIGMTVLGAIALLACLFSTQNQSSDSGTTSEVAASIAKPSKIRVLYSKWEENHERLGGDRNVVIPVGFSKGFSEEDVIASGHVRMDLVNGDVEAHVEAPLEEAELWLVDNDPQSSAMVDASDSFKRVGKLVRDEYGLLSVKRSMGKEAFADFDVDLVVVTRVDAKVTGKGLAYGSPRTFQRMYTAKRKGKVSQYAQNFIKDSKDHPLKGVLTSVAKAEDPIPADPDVIVDSVVALGAKLFIEETFDGNGRTCNSCHPMANNTTLDADFIATLPANDPLFVAEFNPDLADLEKPHLMRQFGLILENVDGFTKPGVMRSVTHTLALSTSLQPPTCVDPNGCFLPPDSPSSPPNFYGYGQAAPSLDVTNSASTGFPLLPGGVTYPVQRTGWGGDGAPGDGSLRSFAIGAIVQHATKTLNRVEGSDFRLPTDAELDALELFQLSLGRLEDPPIRDIVFLENEVSAGRDIFIARDTQFGQVQAGKCSVCHQNAGARQDAQDFGAIIAAGGLTPNWEGNQTFPTGIQLVPSPAALAYPADVPPDGGFGHKSLNGLDCSQVAFGFDPATGGPTLFPTGAPGPGGFGIQGATAFSFPALSAQGTDPTLPGQCLVQFNVPTLVEAADTAPFFHQNQFPTLEGAIGFYNRAEFNNDPGVSFFLRLADSTFTGINLTDQSVDRVGKFLRVLNTLENLRSAKEFVQAAKYSPGAQAQQLPTNSTSNGMLVRALQELDDTHNVLLYTSSQTSMQHDLHPAAQLYISDAESLIGQAQTVIGVGLRKGLLDQAVTALENARRDMILVN